MKDKKNEFLLSENEIDILLEHYKEALSSINQYKKNSEDNQIDREKSSSEFKRFTDLCAMIINIVDNTFDECSPYGLGIKYGYRVIQDTIDNDIMYDKYSRMLCRDCFNTEKKDENGKLIQNIVERYVILEDVNLYYFSFQRKDLVDFLNSMKISSKVIMNIVGEDHPCIEFIITDYYKTKQEYIDDRARIQEYLNKKKEEKS